MSNRPSSLLYQEWLHELSAVRRYSAHTLEGYSRDIQRLETYRIQYAEKYAVWALTAGHIRQAVGLAHKEGLEARSISRLLAAWRSFYEWGIQQGALQTNPAKTVKAPKAPKLLPKALSVEQVQGLLESPPQVERAGEEGVAAAATLLRDAAMFELLYSSGLRLSELVSLDVHYTSSPAHTSQSWVDWQEQEVHVTGKGGKKRMIPVGSVALEALRHWVEKRAQWLSPNPLPADAAALFLGVRGKRITPRVVQIQLAAWAQQAGVATQVHPHVLRHSFASHVLQSSEDLRAVQELLGHSSIATTQIYTRLDFQHLSKAYDKAHPRAQRKNK